MDILNPRSLRDRAQHNLARGQEPKKLVTAYAAITGGLSLVVNLVNLWLDEQIAGTGGLSNLGTRAIFSTIQSFLPMALMAVTMCLELGYLSGMLRISRGQYADHTDLKTGFRKFWPLLRMSLIQGFVILGGGILAIQFAALVFTMTPWAEPMMEVLAPLAESGAALDESTVLAMADTFIPLMIITGIVYLAVLIPIMHRFRMANYCLLDESSGRAMIAIRKSSRMMRRRFVPMLKIDLSLWLYYAATALTTVILYLDLILAAAGIPVPLDAQVFALLVYVAALVLQFGIQFTLRNKVELTYLAAYEQLQEKPKDNGVVLGNIFDM